MFYIATIQKVNKQKSGILVSVVIYETGVLIENVQLLAPFGYTATPKKNDGVLVFVPKGDNSLSFAFLSIDSFAKNKAELEIYTEKLNVKSKDKVVIDGDKEITVKSKDKVVIDADKEITVKATKLILDASSIELAGNASEILTKNAQMVIPAGQVIVSVSGQAVGTPNPSPIAIQIQTPGQTKVKSG